MWGSGRLLDPAISLLGKSPWCPLSGGLGGPQNSPLSSPYLLHRLRCSDSTQIIKLMTDCDLGLTKKRKCICYCHADSDGFSIFVEGFEGRVITEEGDIIHCHHYENRVVVVVVVVVVVELVYHSSECDNI